MIQKVTEGAFEPLTKVTEQKFQKLTERSFESGTEIQKVTKETYEAKER